MAGLFDNIFGGGAGSMFGGNSLYADMLTPEQMAAVRNQSMMQVAAKLLESSGPSTTRRSLGQTLGGALSAGAEAMQTGQTNAVQQMLLKQKLDEAKLQKDQAARVAEIFGSGQGAAPLTAVDAINAPTGGAVGPTVGRAGTIGATPATPSKADQAARYRQAAAVFAADPIKSKAYMDIADQLDPREKFSTTPQFGRSPAGTPISYVLSESGGMKILDVQQNPDFTYQDMGGYISVRDKRNNQEVEKIKKSMSPSEAANYQVAQGNLGVAQSRLALDQQRFEREGQPGAVKATEGQLGAAGFATRMEAAEDIFSKIPAAQIPRYGMSGQSSIMSYFRSPEGQMAKQAADDWIRSKLRKESGAVIGEEEMEAEYKTYFPMPGDSAQVVAQKAQARQRATDAMRRNAGPAYQPYVPPAPTAPAAQIPGLGTGTVDLSKYFPKRP